MKNITPFLWFDDNAEKAVNFYVSVIKNSKINKTVKYGKAGPGPEGRVMTIAFELNGQPFAAINGGPIFHFNESVSFVINCDDQQEIDYYWQKLTADGGQESQCGWLKDKFGLSWQVVPVNIAELLNSTAAVQAMFKMKKLDIDALRNAGK